MYKLGSYQLRENIFYMLDRRGNVFWYVYKLGFIVFMYIWIYVIQEPTRCMYVGYKTIQNALSIETYSMYKEDKDAWNNSMA